MAVRRSVLGRVWLGQRSRKMAITRLVPRRTDLAVGGRWGGGGHRRVILAPIVGRPERRDNFCVGHPSPRPVTMRRGRPPTLGRLRRGRLSPLKGLVSMSLRSLIASGTKVWLDSI